MNPDVHTLTGAYSLDALDDDERELFERHLADCPDCTQEVAELKLTANRLGAAVAIQPPDRLKTRVMAEISRIRQDSPAGPRLVVDNGPVQRRGPRRWVVNLTVAAAAVALALAGAFGVVAVRTQNELHSAQTQLAQANSAYTPIAQVLSAPDLQATSASGVAGGTAAAMVSRKLDRGVLMAFNLPAAPAGKSLQAWAIGPEGKRSIGLLDSAANGATSPIVINGVKGATLIGVTVEPAGGSRQPTTTPVMLFDMPA